MMSFLLGNVFCGCLWLWSTLARESAAQVAVKQLDKAALVYSKSPTIWDEELAVSFSRVRSIVKEID